MTAYIVPVLFIIVLLVSIFAKKDAYSAFVTGSRSSISLMISVFPYLLTIMMAVEVFRVSGVSKIVADYLGVGIEIFGIPKELTELVLIRPLSGAGALSTLENIYASFGTDTFIGNCASVIYGSSETVFYIATIYTSGCNLKKTGYAIPVALVASFLGCVLGCFLCRFI